MTVVKKPVSVVSKTLSGDFDPFESYRQIVGPHSTDTALLESRDVETRESQKSTILAKAALKIVCTDRVVEIKALTKLGTELLRFVVIPGLVPGIQAKNDRLVFQFEEPKLEHDLAKQLKQPSPLDVLREISRQLLPEGMSLIGCFSYDMMDLFEKLPEAKVDKLEFPNFTFWFPESLIEINHLEKTARVSELVLADLLLPLAGEGLRMRVVKLQDMQARELLPLPTLTPTLSRRRERDNCDLSDEAFENLVLKLKEHIKLGDVFQIVPSRTFELPCPNPQRAYQELQKLNPSPYMFFIDAGDWTLFGASPETFIKVDGHTKRIQIRPIAGTRPRSRLSNGEINHDREERLETELRLDQKEMAEHLMLVDLARNDVARVSRLGTRRVDKLLSIERYSHVMHLVSQVVGELKEGLDALHAYQACLNMGTLVGAPKIKAAQLLRQNEPSKRGPYGGAVGYLSSDGSLDTAIVIRSALVKNGQAYVRAGAGVVYDSDPKYEAAETLHKANAVLQAILLSREESK